MGRSYPFTCAVLSSILLVAAPLKAETIRQNFEMVVDRVFPPTNYPVELPSIGTRGTGSLTFESSQIQFNPDITSPTFGYATRQPLQFSLDFFNQRYSQVPVSGGIFRDGSLFRFRPTDTGSYQLIGYQFSTSDYKPGILMSGGRSGNFNYAAVAYGTVTLTDSEPIPEPTTIAGIPVAIAFGWKIQRRLRRKRRV